MPTLPFFSFFNGGGSLFAGTDSRVGPGMQSMIRHGVFCMKNWLIHKAPPHLKKKGRKKKECISLDLQRVSQIIVLSLHRKSRRISASEVCLQDIEGISHVSTCVSRCVPCTQTNVCATRVLHGVTCVSYIAGCVGLGAESRASLGRPSPCPEK